MLPVLFYLVLSNTVGEAAFGPGIAPLEAQARQFPPKRSPWHGQGQSALKVTLWEAPGVPRKMRVDATQEGAVAQDLYWFEEGKLAYGLQTRTAGDSSFERRLVFEGGRLKAGEERRGGRTLPLVARDLARLDQDVAALVKTCLAAPGLRSRQAVVKAVEPDRVVFAAGPEIDAWVQRRPGDKVAASLVGRKVLYDFTAVDWDGRETDYLNLIRPVGAAPVAKKGVAKKTIRPRARRK